MRKDNQYTKAKSDFEKIKAKLVVGNKYTLWGYSEFGFPFQLHFKLVEVVVEPYAQYDASLLIWYRKFRQRSDRGLRRLDHEKFLIFEDWVQVDCEMYTEVEGNMRKSLPCFSPDYFGRAMKSVDKPPLVHYEGRLI
jgi:hypothetical protein